MFFTRDKSFYKTLVTLAIPIALQNAVTFAVGLADNVMIGTLGDSAISGVYVGSQLQTLLQMLSLFWLRSIGVNAIQKASAALRLSVCGLLCSSVWSLR